MERVAKDRDSLPAPRKSSAKYIIQALMDSIDVRVNGDRPWDIQIHNNDFYTRVFKQGSLGLGEAYMDQLWDCAALDVLFDKVLRARLDRNINIPWPFKIKHFLANFINFQTKALAKKVAHQHYNIGNDLFSAMLDPRMIYSCGYWKTAQTLTQAQAAKLDLICQKLQLKPNERLLDIGCGWGGLAKFAAENYGAHVTGVTISEQQHQYAVDYCKGLPIEIRLQDYRDVNDKFDKIVSVGMFEHVGHLNYPIFMKTVSRCLAENGLFLLHTIGGNETTFFANEWITKYIFPNGMLPSQVQITKSSEKTFIMEDWHNFGAYYDLTLMAWHKRFIENWPALKSNYDDRFYRMWVYYLLACAGGFRSRTIQLWQIVYSSNGIVGGYMAPR